MGTLNYLKDKKRLLPIILIGAAQLILYYAVRLLPLFRERVSMETAIDAYIPFLPFFIVFYISAYIQWVLHVHLIAQEDMPSFLCFIRADLIAKGICMICFVILPATMERPDVVPDGPFTSIVYLIYTIDKPINLFPSIHCMLAWLDMRTALRFRRAPSFFAIFSVPFSLLVIASTLFVKQHVFVDTLAGILCAEASLWISSRTAGRSNT